MYLEMFNEYTKEGATKENIINALAVINATILARTAENKNDDEEIMMFSDFFINRMKRNTDLQPDGSIVEDKREVFITAPSFFYS